MTDDELTEAIALAIDPDARDLRVDFPESWEEALSLAAAVLPIVRSQQAEAVEEYKRSRVTVHITSPPPSETLVPVLRPCPRCGHR